MYAWLPLEVDPDINTTKQTATRRNLFIKVLEFKSTTGAWLGTRHRLSLGSIQVALRVWVESGPKVPFSVLGLS